MGEPDYYAVLGVSPASEEIVIQGAYRALMRRYHPDKNPSEAARKRTVEINAAYAVLGDAAKRAAYDARRKTNASQNKSSSRDGAKPPPPPPKSSAPKHSPAPTNNELGSGRGGLIFASILTIFIVVSLVLSAPKATDIANNTMNVDENLTTTDMNVMTTDMAATDMNAMNAADMNVVEPVAPDLSKQSQTVVSYSTIESAAKRVAKILTTKGIAGARAYSEDCHKAVQATPSWDAADGCAAFDYAVAYIDDAVSTQNGWPKDGYFQFQSGNEPDSYASIGAPTFMTDDRLSKIRAAAQSAALDAYRMEITRRSAVRGAPAERQSVAVSNSVLGNSSD